MAKKKTKVKWTKLKKWIDNEGADVVVKKLKVTRQTVHYWHRSHCLPKSDQMLKIKKISGISIDTMVEEYFQK